MSENEGAKSAGSLRLNAVPFVPTAAAATPSPSDGKTQLAELVKAAPFVPQSAKQTQANNQQSSGSSKPVGGKNVNTAPFVPRGSRRPGQATVEDVASATVSPLAQSQPHGALYPGRGGYGGRGASPMKPGGRGLGPQPASPAFQSGRGGGGGRGEGGMGGGYGGHGRGRSTYAVASGAMVGALPPGPMGHGYAAGMPGGMPMAVAGPSALPSQRPHEPYLLGPGWAMLQTRFIGDGFRQQLQQQSYHIQAQWSHESAGVRPEEFVALPERVHHYHTLYPLEEPSADGNDRMSQALSLRTFVLKGISAHDGQAYALRKVCGKQVIPSVDLLSNARNTVEAWAQVSNHPNLVGLRSVFVSSELEGGSALFFVHDYHPCSVTLAQAHLQPSASASGILSVNTVSEPMLWSYLVQLTSALRCVHNAGLALRPGCLHPTKVLLTSFGRLRVSCCGMLDALNPAEIQDHDDLHHMHRMELTALGQLLLGLACAGISPTPTLDVCAMHYSMELTRIIAALLASSEGGQLGSWRQLAAALADRTMAELDNMSVFSSGAVTELAKECDNGRLVRLLVKLGFVNERPELDGDPQWAETGDRYLLKLFRDFVFHQTSEDGTPVMDWGHVMEAMNKLDAGVPEKILLMSRDEQSMLVVSYADLKRCVEGTYGELRQSSRNRAM